MLVWLEVKASQNVPDALVVDLLPAGLELENQNLASSSASLQDSGGSEVQNLLSQMQQADIQHMEFRDDRFVAAVPVNEGSAGHAGLSGARRDAGNLPGAGADGGVYVCSAVAGNGCGQLAR